MKKTLFCLALAFSWSTSALAQAEGLPQLPPTLGGLFSNLLDAVSKAAQPAQPAQTPQEQTPPPSSEALESLAAFADMSLRLNPELQCAGGPRSKLSISAEVGTRFRTQGRNQLAAESYRDMASIFAWCAIQPGIPGTSQHVVNASEFLTLSLVARGGQTLLANQDAQWAYEISEVAGQGQYEKTKTSLEPMNLFDARKPRVVAQAGKYELEGTAAQFYKQFMADRSVFRFKNDGKTVKVTGFLRERVDITGGSWSFELGPTATFNELYGGVHCRTFDTASIEKGISVDRGALLTVSGRFDLDFNKISRGMLISRCVIH